MTDKIILDPPIWLERERGRENHYRTAPPISINQYEVKMHETAYNWMGNPEILEVGTAKIPDSLGVVLTLKPGQRGRGYVVGMMSKTMYRLGCAPLLDRLTAQGLQLGYYQLCKHKDEDIYFGFHVPETEE